MGCWVFPFYSYDLHLYILTNCSNKSINTNISMIHDTGTLLMYQWYWYWYVSNNVSWYLILDTFLYHDTYHDTCIIDIPQHCTYSNVSHLLPTKLSASSLSLVSTAADCLQWYHPCCWQRSRGRRALLVLIQMTSWICSLSSILGSLSLVRQLHCSGPASRIKVKTLPLF